MLITRRNGKSCSESSDAFPRLHPGCAVSVRTKCLGTLSGAVLRDCGMGTLMLETEPGRQLRLYPDDVEEIVITKGCEL